MNEQLPCTTSTGLQTVTGLLYLFAILLALTLIVCIG